MTLSKIAPKTLKERIKKMKESGFTISKVPKKITRNGKEFDLINAHLTKKGCNEQISWLKESWDKEFFHFTTKPTFYVDDRSEEYGVFLLYTYRKPFKVKNWK